MNVPIYHNSNARDELIAFIDKSKSPLRGKRKDIEGLINKLTENVISGVVTPTKKFKSVKHSGVQVTAEYYSGHEDQDYIYVTYWYNPELDTLGDEWVEYQPLSDESDDPLLITGMIADEGF